MTSDWYEVDKNGLAKLLSGRPKVFVVHELLQNAWDEDCGRVDVTMEPVPRRAAAVLRVEDDCPNGFADLAHTYTLFAESKKKGDPRRRGRFNLGEKLVLALCAEAQITSTTGTIRFGSDGTRTRGRRKTDAGTVLTAEVRMTREELDAVERSVRLLLPPESCQTTFNGQTIEPRVPVVKFTASLPTVLAAADGELRRTRRKCSVHVHEPRPGESPTIFEMGIPVVESEGRYHVDIQQKVPLNMDRDNVTLAYRRQLNALVLNAVHHLLDAEQAAEGWVSEALGHSDVGDAAVRTVIEARHGDGRAAYDPSDREANNRLVAKGFEVVHGGSYGAEQWKAIKRAGALSPSGQISPTPKAYDEAAKEMEKLVPLDKWTTEMDDVARLTQTIAWRVLGLSVGVIMARAGPNFRACFEHANHARHYAMLPGLGTTTAAVVRFNLTSLRPTWWSSWRDHLADVVDLIVHELGHSGGHHLEQGFHRALTKLAGGAVDLALREPELFNREGPSTP